jgi:hypothetical protein
MTSVVLQLSSASKVLQVTSIHLCGRLGKVVVTSSNGEVLLMMTSFQQLSVT